jgi:hypothetical protein
MPRRFPLYRYVLGATAAAFLFNILLRVPLKIGGMPATLLAALLSAWALCTAFAWIEGRRPQAVERWLLVALYSLQLGLLYLVILGLMWLKDEPGDMGLLLFFFHYLVYPAALLLVLHISRKRPG